MDLKRKNYQRTTSWNAPYTFSGKEKDVETGYGYFGARYYDSGLSIWLSVDPMSDKYPSMSPYNYCANNPVILVDPDGNEIIPYGLLVHWGADLGGNSRLDQSMTIGMYTVTPFYDSNKNLIGYNAGLFIRDAAGNETFRTDYQFAPGDLEQFKSDIEIYELAAKLIYSSGEPDWNSVSMGYNIMNQEFGAAFNDWAKVWGDAIRNPNFWISIAISYTTITTISNTNVNSIVSNAEKGMMNAGSATTQEVFSPAKKFLGKNYTISANGKEWISSCGTKRFRVPMYKVRQGKLQANFETGSNGKFTTNSHVDVTP